MEQIVGYPKGIKILGKIILALFLAVVILIAVFFQPIEAGDKLFLYLVGGGMIILVLVFLFAMVSEQIFLWKKKGIEIK